MLPWKGRKACWARTRSKSTIPFNATDFTSVFLPENNFICTSPKPLTRPTQPSEKPVSIRATHNQPPTRFQHHRRQPALPCPSCRSIQEESHHETNHHSHPTAIPAFVRHKKTCRGANA